jgi:hypothetical protein
MSTVSRKSGVLGGALKMTSHDVYIKEQNRGTFLKLNKTIMNTSAQLKTEGGVSKHGLCR